MSPPRALGFLRARVALFKVKGPGESTADPFRWVVVLIFLAGNRCVFWGPDAFGLAEGLDFGVSLVLFLQIGDGRRSC